MNTVTRTKKQGAAPAHSHTHPRTIDCNGTAVVVDLLRPDDEAALLAFAQSLPEQDLLFTYRDITQPRVVKAWIREATERHRMPSLLARVDGKSPVEYLSAPDRERVRQIALPLIGSPVPSPYDVKRVWASRLGL